MGSIDIIGLGTTLSLPSSAAQEAIANADLIIGAKRHLANLPITDSEKRVYPSPFDETLQLIHQHANQNVVLLASGDPLFYGIGGFLRRTLPDRELTFHPNVSSMQSACARLELPWQDLQFLSLHGRPVTRLRATLRKHQTLILLTDPTNHPALIAQHLLDCGYEQSMVHVLESLDSKDERIGHYEADELATFADDAFNPLNVVVVHTEGRGGLLPEFPGIDDNQLLPDADGRRMFTKRQVRLNALSLLQSESGNIGWDLGAGCGGLTLEWVRWHPRTQVHAVEANPMRLECLHANRQRFGDHGNLSTWLGNAPQALDNLPNPDRIFIGGNAGQLPAILETSWARLKPQGRLVAVAVTLESRQQLLEFAADKQPHWEEISISQNAALGDQTSMKPQLPVLMLLVSKP